MTHHVQLDLAIPAELPRGFSGYLENNSLLSPGYIETLGYDILFEHPIELSGSGCNGSCKATIRGPGVSKEGCTTRTWPITPPMLSSMNAAWGIWKDSFTTEGTPMTRLPAFSIYLATPFEHPVREAMTLEVGYVEWSEDLHGTYTLKECYLLPAIVEYEILVEGSVVSLPRNADQGKVLHLANNTNPFRWANDSTRQENTMISITSFMAVQMTTNTSVNLTPTSGVYSIEYYSMSPETFRHLRPGWTSSRSVVFNDPTETVVSEINQAFLRGSTMVGSWSNLTELVDPGVATNQSVMAAQTVTQNVFHSDMVWFAAAAAVQFVTVFFILPMFWGYWTVGSNLTMSPFSTALALDAPLLNEVNSAAGPCGVVEKLGSVKIKLGMTGVVGSGAEVATTGRLGLDKERVVWEPRRGDRFSS
ncbi:uncharacterized protein LTR77_004832 [Saxophila tyrrhenica]|uniref:Transmembrane protein n=1 Tax=Saxophila tyrrhenica TaxID=1690608 RepID=A0AAV9PAL9_9PEZI|nr:hypothetical protein LTR77_004832 [Saxophila tyrrhenica]